MVLVVWPHLGKLLVLAELCRVKVTMVAVAVMLLNHLLFLPVK